MHYPLKWKKNFFSTLFTIHSNDQQVGKLNNELFSQNAVAELHGMKCHFRTKGFFGQQTEIIDPLDNKTIGTIAFNDWMTSATISIGTEKLQWKYDNLWNTRWRVSDAGGIDVTYSGYSTSGQIDSNTQEPLIILCGLYVTNYFWQMILVCFLIVMIPIIAT